MSKHDLLYRIYNEAYTQGENQMHDNTILMSLSILPLLFFILIFITYLNVLESKRTKSLDDKLGQINEYMKKISDKLTEKPE